MILPRRRTHTFLTRQSRADDGRAPRNWLRPPEGNSIAEQRVENGANRIPLLFGQLASDSTRELFRFPFTEDRVREQCAAHLSPSLHLRDPLAPSPLVSLPICT